MTKHEAPPFKMVVEAGRLVPATPFDAERLDTYRRGTRISVRFTEEKDRVLVRKWWAVIGRAVKECKTPWKTRDEASEAIKLALGIVNLSKTVTGKFMQYPKSLTELTDPELDEAVMQMMEIIHHITGVDPDEWKKQIGDIGQDDQENTEPSDATHAGSDAGSSDGAPSGAASALPAKAGVEPGESLPSSQDEETPGSEPINGYKRMLMEECIDGLIREAFSDPAEERLAKIARLTSVFLEEANLASEPRFVNLCAETARRVAGNKAEQARARAYLITKLPAAEVA